MAENTSESKNNPFGKANDDWAKHLRPAGKRDNNKKVRKASKDDVKQQTRDMKEAAANELSVTKYKDYHSAAKDDPKRKDGIAKASQLAVTKILGRKNEAIDYDDLDDRYDTKQNVGGKLGKKGQLVGKPVGSRAAQQRHELPRKNRLDKVRNTMKEIGAPIVEGPPMMTREEAKAWLQEKVSKNRGKESLEDRKKKALHAYHARMLGKKEGVEESQGDLFDSPPKKTAPTAPTSPKAAPTAPKPASVVKKAAPTAPKPASPTSSVTVHKVKPASPSGLETPTSSATRAVTHTKVVGSPTAPKPATPQAPKSASTNIVRKSPPSIHQHGPTDISGEKSASVKRAYDTEKTAQVSKASSTQGSVAPGSREARKAILQTKRELGNNKKGAWTAGVDKVKKVAEPKEVDPYAGAKKLEKDKKWKDVVKTEEVIDEISPTEEMVDEISTTSGAGGYETPGAFAGKSHTAAQLKKKEVFGYKLLPAGKKEFYRDGDKLESIIPQYTANMKTLAESIEVAVREYKKPHQQIGQAVQQIHRQLAQIEKCVSMALKTKTEGKVANTDLWKRTFKHLLKLDSRLTNLAREIREIRT